jgi:hypothetical protein
MRRRVYTAALVVATLAFLAFVWPTLYRYDRMAVEGNNLPVRINRFTGATEFLLPSGWRRTR